MSNVYTTKIDGSAVSYAFSTRGARLNHADACVKSDPHASAWHFVQSARILSKSERAKLGVDTAV